MGAASGSCRSSDLAAFQDAADFDERDPCFRNVFSMSREPGRDRPAGEALDLESLALLPGIDRAFNLGAAIQEQLQERIAGQRLGFIL